MGRILITGGNGYVAKSLYNALSDDYEITLISRKDFDLTSFEATKNFLQGQYFDVVIHAAVVGGSRLKKDTWADMDCNLIMYYNLLQHKSSFGKLIHFGSGAEDYAGDTPYGLSKNVIKKSIQEQDNFFNIQIFGVFDENELDTRFIKSNIKRYINREPMNINVHKRMTFFYMKDLIKLVKHTIDTSSTKLTKEVYCSYIKNYTLREIADMINELDNHEVPIYMTDEFGEDYIAPAGAEYELDYIGVKQGIKEMYNKLK
jgi:nucleoside-diphosphate-sugar epimerase